MCEQLFLWLNLQRYEMCSLCRAQGNLRLLKSCVVWKSDGEDISARGMLSIVRYPANNKNNNHVSLLAH